MSTIVEALGGKPGETIVEALGGKPGESIAEAVEGREEPSPEPTPVVKFTVSYNANGGTGTIPSVEVNEGSSITLSDGSTLTPPENKTFAGWAKSASAQSPTVESPFTPDKDTELFAVWVDA